MAEAGNISAAANPVGCEACACVTVTGGTPLTCELVAHSWEGTELGANSGSVAQSRPNFVF